MHIENVHINLGGGPLAAAALAAILGRESAEPEVPAVVSPPTTLPKIGEAWPGIDGVYAGISSGEDGKPDGHLVLLNVRAPKDMAWQDAIAWAEGLGDGARLPTRFESALLYANLQDQFDTDRWHWTGTQYDSSTAWYQDFDYGTQDDDGKKFEARARAVRRLIL